MLIVELAKDTMQNVLDARQQATILESCEGKEIEKWITELRLRKLMV